MQGARAAGLLDEAAAFGERLAALMADPAARADVEVDVVRALSQGGQLEHAKARLDGLGVLAGAYPARDPRGRAHDLRRRILRLEIARGCSEPAADPTLVADVDALGDGFSKRFYLIRARRGEFFPTREDTRRACLP